MNAEVSEVLVELRIVDHLILRIRVDIGSVRRDRAQFDDQWIACLQVVLERMMIAAGTVVVPSSAAANCTVGQIHPQVVALRAFRTDPAFRRHLYTVF